MARPDQTPTKWGALYPHLCRNAARGVEILYSFSTARDLVNKVRCQARAGHIRYLYKLKGYFVLHRNMSSGPASWLTSGKNFPPQAPGGGMRWTFCPDKIPHVLVIITEHTPPDLFHIRRFPWEGMYPPPDGHVFHSLPIMLQKDHILLCALFIYIFYFFHQLCLFFILIYFLKNTLMMPWVWSIPKVITSRGKYIWNFDQPFKLHFNKYIYTHMWFKKGFSNNKFLNPYPWYGIIFLNEIIYANLFT